MSDADARPARVWRRADGVLTGRTVVGRRRCSWRGVGSSHGLPQLAARSEHDWNDTLWLAPPFDTRLSSQEQSLRITAAAAAVSPRCVLYHAA